MNSLLDTIGKTPLVKLEKLNRKYNVNIAVKLEYFNPTSSIKDRIAKFMIEQAEQKGLLKPGDTIIENSSGNTATGLALIAKQKNYNLILVVRDSLSPDKKKVLQAFGKSVKIIERDSTLPASHPDSYYNFPKKYAAENPNVWYMDQHDNIDNPETHYHTTGQEIWQQTQGKIGVFVASVGTGGTLSGTGKALKEHNKNIKVIGVDPKGSVFRAAFYNKTLPEPHSHFIEGIGNALPTKNILVDYIDDVIEIESKQAIKMAYEILQEEGLIVGPSAAANVWGALHIALKHKDSQPLIVTTIGDTGYKYTNTLFNKEWVDKVLYN